MKATLLIILSLLIAAAAGALVWASLTTPVDWLPIAGIASVVGLLAVIVAVETLDILRADLRSKDRHLHARREEMTHLRAQLASRENEAARLKRQVKTMMTNN